VAKPEMRLKTIAGLWLPLAISFELMMMEGPTVQSAIGRLPQAQVNLAAWGLTLSLSLLIESPVIMLLSTAIALVRDRDTYQALRKFMLSLLVGCTLLTALIAFTPLFDLIAGTVMGQPAPYIAAARPALQIMLFWTAAIGWRRFYQGILVGHGQTRLVSWGTMFRLIAAISVALMLAAAHPLPGVRVAAIALMAAVLTEAVATTSFALPIVRREVVTRPAREEPLTQRAILRFHAPLAATTLLTLLMQPITSTALARLPFKEATLAAWPVTYLLLLVLRGGGLALQEITVAHGRNPEARSALRKFTWIVGGVTSGITIVIAFTPLLDVYLDRILHTPTNLKYYIHLGMITGALAPLMTALGSWARGLLVSAGQTTAVYQGMAINLATNALLLFLGVLLRLPGMGMATGAFTLAAAVEFAYLVRCATPLMALQPEYAV